MKIAQVAPLMESVPPKTYGGTERVVSYLTEALVALGHDVTLFASGDSRTGARLMPVVPRSLRLDPGRPDWLMWHTVMLDQVFEHHGVPHQPVGAAGVQPQTARHHRHQSCASA